MISHTRVLTEGLSAPASADSLSECAGTPEAFVVSMNLHRRHLNESQRAMIAGKVANMWQGKRTDLEPSANLQEVANAQTATMLNVGERSAAVAEFRHRPHKRPFQNRPRKIEGRHLGKFGLSVTERTVIGEGLLYLGFATGIAPSQQPQERAM